MDLNYEDLDKEENAFRKANKTHLRNFKKWLENKGLSEKTINNHVTNIDFYINDFLCYDDDFDIKRGCYTISIFLGDWFIRKATWSSCAQIKANAASIKKFYAFMLENSAIEKDDYAELCETIKDEMSDWLDKMEQEEMADDDYF